MEVQEDSWWGVWGIFLRRPLGGGTGSLLLSC